MANLANAQNPPHLRHDIMRGEPGRLVNYEDTGDFGSGISHDWFRQWMWTSVVSCPWSVAQSASRFITMPSSTSDNGPLTTDDGPSQLRLVLQFLQEHFELLVFLGCWSSTKASSGRVATPAAGRVRGEGSPPPNQPFNDFCCSSALPRTETETRAWWRSRSFPRR